MKRIVTLTVNPAIDKSTAVAGIRPQSKLRCDVPVFEAGGGGVNVSKVLSELGGTSLCVHMSGGPPGAYLKELLMAADIVEQTIPVQGWTRENLAVTDTTNNQQYRFGMPGPIVTESEWKKALGLLEDILFDGDFLVASGSLCPGMPVDFYSKVAALAKKVGAKCILDTSGDALIAGAQAGVHLLKPNLGELAALCGLETVSFQELESVAQEFLKENPCEVLVISLGAQGAIMITGEVVEYIAVPVVYQKSTIGAGDSMVAGMVYALAQGKSLSEMVKYGVACGTAATMTEGSQLCRRKDVEELYQWIESNSPVSTSA